MEFGFTLTVLPASAAERRTFFLSIYLCCKTTLWIQADGIVCWDRGRVGELPLEFSVMSLHLCFQVTIALRTPESGPYAA